MRALTINQGTVSLLTKAAEPKEVHGETRVRVLQAGVCATDLAITRGYMQYEGVLGHEFVGVALDGPLNGRRVVGEINAACGDCSWCSRGLKRHCPKRTVLGILGRDGAFAEFLALPTANLHAVPDGLSNDHAVFVEPLAAAFEILEQVPAIPGAAALVIGDGRLGLLCAQVLARAGLEVTLSGRHPERADIIGPGISHHVGWGLREMSFDVVVEATGDPQVLAQAVPLVRPRGTLVIKTTSERPAQLDLAPIVVHEITLVGSRCGVFPPALLALESASIEVLPLIHARYPLSEGMDALRHAGRPGVLKVIIDVA